MAPMRTLSILLLALAASGATAQSRQYVTDSLRLEARTGPSTEHRIVQMLDSGTRLEVLEEREGWSRVTLPTGEEGQAEFRSPPGEVTVGVRAPSAAGAGTVEVPPGETVSLEIVASPASSKDL